MDTLRSKMTNLLKEAFEKASELPPEEQDSFARFILAELESEARWDELFSKSQSELATLAEEAREEYLSGSTEPLDPDSL